MRIVNAKHRLLVETLLIFASCEAILMLLLPRFLPDLQSGWAATSDVTLLTLTAGALLWWRFSWHYQIAEIRRRAEAEQWAAELRQVNTTLQAEAGERESAQAFLRAVVENLPIPVFIKEARELRFVLWNRAGEELTGIPSAEMIGKSDHDFFPPADAALYVARDRAALTSRGVLETAEETIQTRHHGARITHVWKVPIFDAAGQPTHLLGISEDITERKRIAVTLQQSEER
ncbi:MAG: PAS domain-containing protein, partial [Verrucomicrobia subdivision 3 bacterium]|nr:PAS domain-containing protein [Limisphaerales bacterium]